MMGLTAREMIQHLRRLPPDARLVVSDHDHDPDSGQFNGAPRGVDRASPAMKARGYDAVIYL